jgi:hypothetical protein
MALAFVPRTDAVSHGICDFCAEGLIAEFRRERSEREWVAIQLAEEYGG